MFETTNQKIYCQCFEFQVFKTHMIEQTQGPQFLLVSLDKSISSSWLEAIYPRTYPHNGCSDPIKPYRCSIPMSQN